MNYINRYKILILLLFVKIDYCCSQDFILKLLKNEIDYQVEKYKEKEYKPYFIQFNVCDKTDISINCSLGSLMSSEFNRTRLFSPEIRIGNYTLDNTHVNESSVFNFSYFLRQFPKVLCIEDSAFTISKIIRETFDNNYKNVLDAYKQNNKKHDAQTDKSSKNDFSQEKPNVYYEDNLTTLNFNKIEWENNLKELTAVFKKEEYILTADAGLTYYYSRNYIINTEGSSVVQNVQRSQLDITLYIKCSDNNVVPLTKSFYAYTPEGLPDMGELTEQVNKLKTIALQLKDAPEADAYSGPCILSASASGVFFHEIFGHRIEGDRLNSKYDAQTFKEKIGDKILPEFLSISFDPTIQKYKNTDLFGSYKFDDQAVSSRKVDIVKNGKLINFLMCRTPFDSTSNSNGHGRCSFGIPAVSRQSNMFVESSQTCSESQLKEQLIKICRKKKKKYGLYFKEVTGGFTSTSKFSPNVFNIIPTVVYKVYVDGRPDELVKGVSLIGTPLTMFSEIAQVGNEFSVFNGYCYAESGYVPVSTISPSTLVNKIEIQKTFEIKNQSKQILRPDLIK